MSGNDINELHLLNIPTISSTLEIFHFYISSNDVNELFQFEISGKDINELHPENILFISLISEVFHFDKSGNVMNK